MLLELKKAFDVENNACNRGAKIIFFMPFIRYSSKSSLQRAKITPTPNIMAGGGGGGKKGHAMQNLLKNARVV